MESFYVVFLINMLKCLMSFCQSLMLPLSLLTVLLRHAKRYYAKKHYAKRHYAKRYYAKRHYAKKTFGKQASCQNRYHAICDNLPSKTFEKGDNMPKMIKRGQHAKNDNQQEDITVRHMKSVTTCQKLRWDSTILYCTILTSQ